MVALLVFLAVILGLIALAVLSFPGARDPGRPPAGREAGGGPVTDWIERRRRGRSPLIRRLAEAPSEGAGAPPPEGAVPASVPRPPRERRPARKRAADLPVSRIPLPWAFAVALFFLAVTVLLSPYLVYVAPTLIVGLFVALFAFQFLPRGKLHYALYAAGPVLLVAAVAVTFGFKAFTVAAVVLGTLGVGIVGLWSRRRPARWMRRGAHGAAGGSLGERTRLKLGSPDPGFQHAREGRYTDPIARTKARGRMYWVP